MKDCHRLFNVAIAAPHLFNHDGCAAAIDDLVADLPQQRNQAVCRVVKSRERPNHANVVEQLWEHLRDLAWQRVAEIGRAHV
jgi:hypothetical protein